MQLCLDKHILKNEPTLSPYAAIILAAGKGSRAGLETPKQFKLWRGKTLVQHCVDAFKAHHASSITVVLPKNTDSKLIGPLHEGTIPVKVVTGGPNRQDSVRIALDSLESEAPDLVLIHDAARPVIPIIVLNTLIHSLGSNLAAIPVLGVVDSLIKANGSLMEDAADRSEFRRVQTPQGFRYKEILEAHRQWVGPTTAGDDAQIYRASGGTVKLVRGHKNLRKMTFAEDFMTDIPDLRVGQGFDVHQLVKGEELWLGGIKIQHNKGLAGHSDADVVLHSVVDALLGAAALGDIGTYFSPTEEKWEGASSSIFVEHAVALVQESGYSINNVDVTIICEEPKIGPHRRNITSRIAELLKVDDTQVNVKATTTEKLGSIGRGEGIAAQATVMIQRDTYDR